MNTEKFTVKAQSALVRSQEIATEHQNQYVENLHVLKAMIENEEYVTNYLLKKCNVNTILLAQTLDKAIDHLPKIDSVNTVYLSQSVSTMLQKSFKYLTE
ncbi:MAG: hypothetical protein LBQ64_03070, partial [Bacteroidales bacterium]|nr:hypothetical protein [Bacteroidales bacterium]